MSDLRAIFDLDRIIEPHQAPEFMATRIGYIDQIAEGLMRFWMCTNLPDNRDGSPGMLELKFKVIRPIASYMSAVGNSAEWCRQNGILVPSNATMAERPHRLM